MTRPHWQSGAGPFRADQVRSGDPYELSQGHAIVCAPTGQDGAGVNGLGFAVLDSDPAVKRAGVDAGLALTPDTLRAPDIAVDFTPGEGTWATRAPLVVEYAGRGQDEGDLADKIREFHAAGTRYVWVVRLVGARRVEVHEAGAAVRTFLPGQTLTAPGVLQNPVPVEALFDRDAAHEATLANLLQRKGYRDLDAVREEAHQDGRKEGREEGAVASRRAVLMMLLESAAIETTDDDRDRIARSADLPQLDRWIQRTRTATTRGEVFAD